MGKGASKWTEKIQREMCQCFKKSRDFDNWQIYVKATRVQCGRGVLRGQGTVARFVSLQTLGGGGLELPDTSLGIFIIFNNSNVCFLKLMLKWLVG